MLALTHCTFYDVLPEQVLSEWKVEGCRIAMHISVSGFSPEKQWSLFDISLTLNNSVSGPWLHPPKNHLIVDLNGLSFTLPVFFPVLLLCLC